MTEGYIYLIRTVKYRKQGKSIYKIGRTIQYPFDRFRGEYGKDPDICIILPTHDCKLLEKNLKIIFKEKYDLVKGSEWFEGNVQSMTDDIIDKHREFTDYNIILLESNGDSSEEYCQIIINETELNLQYAVETFGVDYVNSMTTEDKYIFTDSNIFKHVSNVVEYTSKSLEVVKLKDQLYDRCKAPVFYVIQMVCVLFELDSVFDQTTNIDLLNPFKYEKLLEIATFYDNTRNKLEVDDYYSEKFKPYGYGHSKTKVAFMNRIFSEFMGCMLEISGKYYMKATNNTMYKKKIEGSVYILKSKHGDIFNELVERRNDVFKYVKF